MASYARRMVEAGARFVGGCCGTTPDHIRAIVGFVQSVSPRHAFDMGTLPRTGARRGHGPGAAGGALPAGRQARRGTSSSPRSRSCRPRASIPAPMFEQVRQLKAAGVDAVNVPDGPRAQSRMGALLSALMIEREVGLEAVVHYACRDRNLLGMLSDLLGAAAAGLRNLLHHHRRSAEDGPLSRRHGGVRHRRDRADQPGEPAQPRARSRRQSDRATRPGS